MVTEPSQPRISGKKFSQLRDRLVFTQEEFAPLVGMSMANVRRVESREATTIRPKSFRKIAELMKLSLAETAAALAVDGLEAVVIELLPRDYARLKAHADQTGVSVAEAARLLLLKVIPDPAKPMRPPRGAPPIGSGHGSPAPRPPTPPKPRRRSPNHASHR